MSNSVKDALEQGCSGDPRLRRGAALAEAQLAMRERNWRPPARKRPAGRQTGEYANRRQALHDKQNGRCGICEEPLPENAHYDHDHETTEWRGLLCPKCNIKLGYLESFLQLSDWMVRALKYLRKHGSRYRFNNLDYPS